METVWLQRPSADVPWGFRLHGGRDYQTPLIVQKVTPGSIAATGLTQDDVILRIGEADTSALTYAQAMEVIKNSGNLLQLSIAKRGGQGDYRHQVEATSNMTSGALHDLFQDMYQYSDPYGREGALSQPKPPPSTAPPAPSTHSSYTPLQPSPYPAGGGGVAGPSFGQYGSQHYGTGPGSYHPGGIGAGLTPAPGGIGAGLTPAPAPPSYTDVQTHRDHVAYPYQPSQPSPGYPHQPLSGAATYPYQYPHSGSSSTSELSDVSSGFGTSDGKLAGTSPAIARPMMTSPSSGGTTRPYASGSSVDSSSGFGSYSCEAPDQAESAYRAQAPAAGRQDSYPAPPPPLSQYEASVNHSGEPRPYVDDPNPSKSPPNPEPLTAPPPPPVAAAAVAPSPPPPPPPPPPPLPPPKSWKAEQANTETHQPTRLEQQISNMSVGSDYGRQNSYPSPPVPQSPSHPPGAPAPPAPGPYYGAPKAPASPITPPAPRPQPVIPDAVLNMAAKGEPDKKPWSYAPDMESIKEQRDKVRRRTPFGGMPRYQQMLNLPKFEDSPRPRGRTPQTPPTPGHQQAPTTPDYEPGPGEATVAHVQYNSPLDLYSENNVAEAFTGQTDGLVTGVGGLKKDQGKDITQSPVYKMVHGLDGEKSKPRRGVADEGSPFKAPKGPAEDDEITFSGVLDRSEIPSKSFHKLQNMTAGSEIDTTSIRQNISGEIPDEQIGAYDQASIRYTGKNIPSRSFKMLQSLTGDDPCATDVPISQPRRQRRHRPEPQPEEPEQNPDDIVDISYVGSNIPSRSFKVLQHAVGEHEMNQPAQPVDNDDDDDNDDGAAFDEMYYLGGSIPSRSFQLLQSAVGSDPHAIAQERRIRRRNRISSRQNSRTEEEMTSVKSDDTFDEQAYLSGQIALNVDPEEKPKPKRAERTVSRDLAPWEKDDAQTEKNTVSNQEFDEEAYLSGRIPVLGNEPKRTPKPLPSEMVTSREKDEEQTEDDQKKTFDEEAYLAGQISILGGEPKPRPQPDSKKTEIEIPWKKPADEEKTEQTTEFDENAYLAKSDKEKGEAEPEWAKKRRAKLARKQKGRANQFDEDKYLGVEKQEPRQDNDEDNNRPKVDNFDEEAYLAGQITIVGGSPAVPNREPKPATDTRAPWQKAEDVDGSTDEGFDEDAYLRGKIPILRDSVPRELPPRDVNKPKTYRERAPWERADDDDKPVDADKEFDEDKYLAGRADICVRKSVDRDLTSPARSEDQFSKIPSRTFHYLRRSMSREGSPSSSISSGRPPSRQSSYDSQDEDEEPDPNKPYNEMVYVGKKIPSKAFLRLEKSMNRKAKRQAVDPIEHLKERMPDSVDLDSALESLNIDHHDPDEYLEQLKQTVEANSNIKIEAVANEVTDF